MECEGVCDRRVDRGSGLVPNGRLALEPCVGLDVGRAGGRVVCRPGSDDVHPSSIETGAIIDEGRTAAFSLSGCRRPGRGCLVILACSLALMSIIYSTLLMRVPPTSDIYHPRPPFYLPPL